MDKKTDPHILNAARLFNKKPVDVTLAERQIAKNRVFMEMYGATPKQLFERMVRDIVPLPHSILAVPCVCTCSTGEPGHLVGDKGCQAIAGNVDGKENE